MLNRVGSAQGFGRKLVPRVLPYDSCEVHGRGWALPAWSKFEAVGREA